MTSTLHRIKDELRPLIEQELQILTAGAGWPSALRQAVDYSLLSGGKRLRPALALLCCEVCGGSLQTALRAACSLEMVHAYSLIHDDLPCMDDDDLRRGLPTSHRIFGEALAVLAGDALQTLAFSSIADDPHLPPETRLSIVSVLASASGHAGMVGGQVLDLEAERGSLLIADIPAAADWVQRSVTTPADSAEHAGNSFAAAESHAGMRRLLSELQDGASGICSERVDQATRIHRMKTGALLAAAAEIGAISAGAGDEERRRCLEYGQCLGLAFQIADDLLDVTGDGQRMGKTVGRDETLGKLTYPALLGVDGSRQLAEQLVADACRSVNIWGGRAADLCRLAQFIVERDH